MTYNHKQKMQSYAVLDILMPGQSERIICSGKKPRKRFGCVLFASTASFAVPGLICAFVFSIVWFLSYAFGVPVDSVLDICTISEFPG